MEKVEKVVLAKFFHDLGLKNGLSRGKSWPGQLFPLFPRISEEVLFFTKMVEKIGLDNFFHHVYDSKDFLRNSWKKWKKLAWPIFSTTQAVLEVQIVEKLGQDNFLHHFYDSKDFLRNSWKKWKKLAWPTFSTTQAILEAGFTNNFQDFCYQIHGNYWFQGRKHSKNLGQWGGYHIYVWVHMCVYIYVHV